MSKTKSIRKVKNKAVSIEKEIWQLFLSEANRRNTHLIGYSFDKTQFDYNGKFD